MASHVQQNSYAGALKFHDMTDLKQGLSTEQHQSVLRDYTVGHQIYHGPRLKTRLSKTKLLRFSQDPYNLRVFPLGQNFNKVGK